MVLPLVLGAISAVSSFFAKKENPIQGVINAAQSVFGGAPKPARARARKRARRRTTRR